MPENVVQFPEKKGPVDEKVYKLTPKGRLTTMLMFDYGVPEKDAMEAWDKFEEWCRNRMQADAKDDGITLRSDAIPALVFDDFGGAIISVLKEK